MVCAIGPGRVTRVAAVGPECSIELLPRRGGAWDSRWTSGSRCVVQAQVGQSHQAQATRQTRAAAGVAAAVGVMYEHINPVRVPGVLAKAFS